MARNGVMLVESYGNHVLARYACASFNVARGIVKALNVRSPISWDMNEFEFTDSEYENTIGFYGNLSEEELKRHLYIMYGDENGTS